MNIECICIFQLNLLLLSFVPAFFSSGMSLFKAWNPLAQFLGEDYFFTLQDFAHMSPFPRGISKYSLSSYADFIYRAHHSLIVACGNLSLSLIGLLSLECKILKGRGILWLIHPYIKSTLAQCFKITDTWCIFVV